MKKQTSLRQVKIGAGKSTLVYAFIMLIVAFVAWIFTIIFFPIYFDISAFSNESFKVMSLVAVLFVVILIPSVLFLFGYYNKKLQLEHLKGLIEDEKSQIRHYRNSIERNNKETKERINNEMIENNLSYETTNLINQKLISKIKDYHEVINTDAKIKILTKITKHEEILIGLHKTLKLFN
ncbi:MAG: hypothetical protein WAV23_03645 [Minisyncoccia bacterium]